MRMRSAVEKDYRQFYEQQLALARTRVGNGNGVPPLPEPTLPEEEPPVPVEEPQLEPCESLEEMISVQTSAYKRKAFCVC
ncbi:hypothetical protein RRG08_004634 [Elysia crispata]|uniref:Uncharacterized protein n=1 Tax=Elysia crispata TaxID=231223 RepID=A0AAE1DS92_9GAST|nr:hypothetical protein RRG08_004634 [Elysia crispata]